MTKGNLLVVLLLLIATSSAPPHTQQPSDLIFKAYDADEIGTDTGKSRGVSFGDINGDYLPDLYVSNTGGQWNTFYKSAGQGKLIRQPTDQSNPWAAPGKKPGRSEGVNWVDYDNDGDLDLYVCSRGEEANQLFRNEAGKEMVEITGHPLTAVLSTSMACWADIEGDGDLDVLLVGYRTNGNRVFENRGEGSFVERNDVPMAEGTGSSRACACGDVNNDGLPEFFVGNARQPNYYYENRGNWRFEKVTTGLMVEDLGYAYGASWADYDDDGDLDLFVANFDKANLLLSNDGYGHLTPVPDGELVETTAGASKGHSWGDYDNDGDLDLYVGNGTYGPDMRNFLFLNDGQGNFDRYSEGVLEAHADTTAGVTHADLDRDGDLDLFVANWGGENELNRLYINQTTGKNWITFRLQGKDSNVSGIGTQVTIFASGNDGNRTMHRWLYPVSGYGSQNDLELHFGLGKLRRIDSLQVNWPGKPRQTLYNVGINQHWLLKETGEITQIN